MYIHRQGQERPELPPPEYDPPAPLSAARVRASHARRQRGAYFIECALSLPMLLFYTSFVQVKHMCDLLGAFVLVIKHVITFRCFTPIALQSIIGIDKRRYTIKQVLLTRHAVVLGLSHSRCHGRLPQLLLCLVASKHTTTRRLRDGIPVRT